MKRSVMPEILDGLAADDPEALRSRRDLRLINALMGNLRWLRRRVAEFAPSSVVEIGAGDGRLLGGLRGAGRELSGIDLVPRPPDLAAEVGWVQGDVFDNFEARECVVSNLFLHHFDAPQLRELGARLRRASVLCICEPTRSRLALVGGGALSPLVNRVTRHDMAVSIRAGFLPGELPELLGIDDGVWRWRERHSVLGACRLVAWRGRR